MGGCAVASALGELGAGRRKVAPGGRALGRPQGVWWCACQGGEAGRGRAGRSRGEGGVQLSHTPSLSRMVRQVKRAMGGAQRSCQRTTTAIS